MGREIELFRKAYPDISMVEALITDCNGVARGKWVPIGKLETVLEDGLKLPKSALGLDIWGRDIPALAFDNGDIDGYCEVVEGSLRPMLTARGVDQGQLIMTMVDDEQNPYPGDPRQILNLVLGKFAEKDLKPCVAVELEFSLLPHPGAGRPLRDALAGQVGQDGNMYALDELDKHAAMFDALRASFEVQGLPFEGIVKEAAPAQYEINMGHSDDPLEVADQIIRLQRGIRAVAARFNLIASFMSKPMDDEAGNGMHVHCSLLEENGVNVFNDGGEDGSDLLKFAVAGSLAMMPEAMLILAPSFNAYRRFQVGNHAPTVPTWGYDNRTTAVRIPSGPPTARRLEHRVAGADTNPYLCLAVVLAGVLHGIEEQLTPAAPVQGNAWDQEHEAEDLPVLMSLALDRFEKSDLLGKYLTPEFQSLFAKTKRQELDEFHKRVTDFEVESYLRA